MVAFQQHFLFLICRWGIYFKDEMEHFVGNIFHFSVTTYTRICKYSPNWITQCNVHVTQALICFLLVFQVVLKENLILPLFRDEVKLKIMLYLQSTHWCSYSNLVFYWFVQYILLHENYQLYVLPKVLESKRMAKSGRTKQKEADLEYNVAKQVEKMLTYVLHSFCSFIFSYAPKQLVM